MGPTGSAGPTGSVGPTGAAATYVGTTGPTAGYVQHANFIDNYGSVTANTTGVTVTFAKPYVDNPPAITISGPSGAPYLVTNITKTNFLVKITSGTAVVIWRAIGT